jgi:RNA polymerase sigma-70 factor (ECF subfamily)
VAQTFAGRAEAARLTLVDGLAGAVWSVGGRPRVVFGFVVRGGRVVGIEMLGDPETVGALALEPVQK